jgi:hypothetical protein
MLTVKIILTILLSLPVSYNDTVAETTEARIARMETIATSIDVAASKATCKDTAKDEHCISSWKGSYDHLALWLITQGFWESRFSLDVHNGSCNDKKDSSMCDHGRSVSVWQLQKGLHFPVEKWNAAKGSSLEATINAATGAAAILSLSYDSCYSYWGYEGMVSMYATGKTCKWKDDKRGPKNRNMTFLNLEKKSAQLVDDEQKELVALLGL